MNQARAALVILLMAPVSGASALIFQVLWQREIRLFIGAGPLSFALIVALFLGGLFVGYRLFSSGTESRSAQGNWRLLLFLEGALSGLAVLSAVALPWARESLWALLLLIFPAAVLFGGFLPVAAQVLLARKPDLRAEARLYGLHTLGAALGAWLAGFYLLPVLGVRASFLLVAVLSALFVVVVWWVRPASDERGSSRALAQGEGWRKRHLVTVVLAGATGIGLQMLAYRLLSLAIGDAGVIFPLLLGVFIFLTALGALVSGPLSRSRSPERWLLLPVGNILLLIASVTMWPAWFGVLARQIVPLPMGFFLFHFVAGLWVALWFGPAVIVTSALTPLMVSRHLRERERIGRALGSVFAWNTLGCMLGSVLFGVGVFLIFDLREALWVLAGLAMISAWVFGLRAWWPALALLLPLFLPWKTVGLLRGDIQQFAWYGEREQPTGVVEYRDTPQGSLAIVDLPGDGSRTTRRLIANGRYEASNKLRGEGLRLLAEIPLLLSDREDLDATLVGLGSGATLRKLLSDARVRRCDVFEISEAIVRWQKHFSSDLEYGVASPRVRLHVSDAFVGIDRLAEPVDIVTLDLSAIWTVGAANFISAEFYRKLRKRMSSDGIVVQWIPAYDISVSAFAEIIASWREVFPEFRIFYFDGDAFFVGAFKPLIWGRLEKLSRLRYVDVASFLTNSTPLSINTTHLEFEAWKTHLRGDNVARRLRVEARPLLDLPEDATDPQRK